MTSAGIYTFNRSDTGHLCIQRTRMSGRCKQRLRYSTVDHFSKRSYDHNEQTNCGTRTLQKRKVTQLRLFQ